MRALRSGSRSCMLESRRIPLVVFGHSVGGIIAPLLVGASRDVAGIIVYGTPVMRWIDCLVDSSACVSSSCAAQREAEIVEAERSMRALADRGELNGRSAAYHAQLAAIDIEAAWRAVEAAVLVVRGEHDWVVRADDQARIAKLVRGEHDDRRPPASSITCSAGTRTARRVCATTASAARTRHL